MNDALHSSPPRPGAPRRPGPALVLLLLLLLVALALGLHHWWSRDTSLQRVRSSGVLRIGYAVEPPYAWVGTDGQVVGESPDSARHIARRLGVPHVDWVQVGFGELIPGLLERRFDVAAAGLFVTAARQRQVRFSAPTVRVLPGLLVRHGNPLQLHSYRGLQQSPARVAVVEGSVEQQRLLPAIGLRLLAVPDAATGRAALAGGRVDALALSQPTLLWMTRDLPGAFEVVADTGAPGDAVAFAFHPDAAALQAAWDAAQVGWVGSEAQRRLVAPLGFVVASPS